VAKILNLDNDFTSGSSVSSAREMIDVKRKRLNETEEISASVEITDKAKSPERKAVEPIDSNAKLTNSAREQSVITASEGKHRTRLCLYSEIF
jgi:hypothetical protein